jgi:hypothetical protein
VLDGRQLALKVSEISLLIAFDESSRDREHCLR